MTIIGAGDPAPDFTLKTSDGEDFTREQLLGRTTVLVFYPFAFSPVCTDQLSLYNEVLEDFAAQGATLYGVSCDATYSQRAFKEQLGVEIEQLSDFEPKGAACRAFGVYHPGGFPERALVVIDADGTVQVEPPGRAPGRAARRQPDLRRAVLSDLGSAPLPPIGPADHVRGDGRLVIVYGDYECPYCAALELQLREHAVRVCFRHFPVKSSHPRAYAAACAAEAAALQAAFWPMHDALFADQGRLEDPHLWERARAAGPRRGALRRRPPLGRGGREGQGAVPLRRARRGGDDPVRVPGRRRCTLAGRCSTRCSA